MRMISKSQKNRPITADSFFKKETGTGFPYVHPAVLSISSGLLFFLAWPVSPLTFLIFVAFVPLFILAAQSSSSRKFFGWIYLNILIWNVSTTWWIANSTVPGAIGAFIGNSLLMSIPWLVFYFLFRRRKNLIGLYLFICIWLSFEYLHLNWDLSWPWLTLGNVFATHPNWVQWYEVTGSSGGSLWVLLVNIFLFQLIRHSLAKKQLHVRSAAAVIGFLVLPFFISWYFLRKGIFRGQTPNNVVVVQPNVDPYSKFVEGQQYEQLANLLQLSRSAIDSNTKLLIWPETAIPAGLDISIIDSHPFLEPVRELLRQNPNLNLLSGVEGFKIVPEPTDYSQKVEDGDVYFESYNSAALMDTNSVQIYHKSKLVPGVETLPSFLKFLANWFEQFGGTTGGYAKQSERTVLIATNSSFKIAPSICYESIYGEFMSKYVKKGANLIAIITNDGWWSETPGYRQHMNYARLRAIETRTWVARSANTGISCFIDTKGKVYQPQPWDTKAAIKMQIPRSNFSQTFFVRNGDFISKIAIVGMIILAVIQFLISKKPIIGKENQN